MIHKRKKYIVKTPLTKKSLVRSASVLAFALLILRALNILTENITVQKDCQDC